MAIWDGADNVEVGEARDPNLTVGKYLLEFAGAVAGTGKKSQKDYLRLKVKVLEASGPGATPVGTTASFAITAGKFDYHLKEQIGLVRALVKEPTAKVTGAMIANLVNKQADFAGEKFRLTIAAVPGKTYSNGDPITERSYFPYEGLETAAIPVTTKTTTNAKTK